MATDFVFGIVVGLLIGVILCLILGLCYYRRQLKLVKWKALEGSNNKSNDSSIDSKNNNKNESESNEKEKEKEKIELQKEKEKTVLISMIEKETSKDKEKEKEKAKEKETEMGKENKENECKNEDSSDESENTFVIHSSQKSMSIHSPLAMYNDLKRKLSGSYSIDKTMIKNGLKNENEQSLKETLLLNDDRNDARNDDRNDDRNNNSNVALDTALNMGLSEAMMSPGISPCISPGISAGMPRVSECRITRYHSRLPSKIFLENKMKALTQEIESKQKEKEKGKEMENEKEKEKEKKRQASFSISSDYSNSPDLTETLKQLPSNIAPNGSNVIIAINKIEKQGVNNVSVEKKRGSKHSKESKESKDDRKRKVKSNTIKRRVGPPKRVKSPLTNRMNVDMGMGHRNGMRNARSLTPKKCKCHSTYDQHSRDTKRKIKKSEHSISLSPNRIPNRIANRIPNGNPNRIASGSPNSIAKKPSKTRKATKSINSINSTKAQINIKQMNDENSNCNINGNQSSQWF